MRGIGALSARLDPTALAAAWRTFWWSRLLIFALGIYAWLRIPAGFVRGPNALENQRLMHAFDGWPAGGVFRALLEPFAAWDGIIYLGIAQGGYPSMAPFVDGAPASTHAVFFPGYPGAVRVASLFINSPGAVMIGAYLVSFVTFFGALYLLHRLTALELGADAARATLLLIAFAPIAFVFGAPFTESMFLFLTVGAVYAARTGHWGWAGVAAALATATRNSGLFLLAPLGIMYLWGPRGDREPGPPIWGFLRLRYRPRADILWLALPLLALGAYMLYLQQKFGDPLAWVHGQDAHHRVGATPWGGLWDSIKAAWNPLTGHPSVPYFDFGSLNVLNLAVFVAACAGLVGVFRRLPAAYGWYVVPALVLPLTDPWPVQPIASMPRYLLVVFPLFMWAGWWSARTRRTEHLVAVMAAIMAVLAVQFATGFFTV